MMASWTCEHSRVLSVLLDEVVGTQEMIEIRQDFCRILDCLNSNLCTTLDNMYFTGSRAEGLDLPGSDDDYMQDINILAIIKVIQSIQEDHNTSLQSVFLMSTDNFPPGFTLIQHVQQSFLHPFLDPAFQDRNGVKYLSSDLFLQTHFNVTNQIIKPIANFQAVQRQGPSIEHWSLSSDTSESGTDHVLSIHCAFWPNAASEWALRERHFGWPSSHDISSIINFGCHLVPIGHPHSKINSLEWRMSFSVAERTLVWSFNHVQNQCYAVMKIILKEFIKVKCSQENQVLCSYFIKTFLFWKYETTEMSFWREENIRECIKYLLVMFSQCIQVGVLRHYFIPKFNLLSVKLTRAAQTELLQCFDVIIQSDVHILKECETLQNVWSEFLTVGENRNIVISNLKRHYKLKADKCMKEKVRLLNLYIESGSIAPYIIKAIMSLTCKTPLHALILKKYLFQTHLRSLIDLHDSDNKVLYQLGQIAQNGTYSFDLSTHKLWYAILLYMKGDYSSTLNMVNEVLSSIPPFAINDYASNDTSQLYQEMFLDSDTTVIHRARNAWMFDLNFMKDRYYPVPLAIQIELYFCLKYVPISPHTCAYYLQFLSYHKMHQYDNRDCALQQLIEVTQNEEQNGIRPFISYNIAGHCLLLAGKREQAKTMFYESYRQSQMKPLKQDYNSALWYLMNCF